MAAKLGAPSDGAAPKSQSGATFGPLVGGLSKRALDLIVSSLALIVFAPLLLVIAAIVKVTMGGPVIFSHERIGQHGRVFRCYKFRTMVNGAEQTLERYLAANPSVAREWNETRKLLHDPRVTSIGRLLRRSSLDELPQLFNVLRGDMSCVGPRPVTPAELQRYGGDVGEYLRTRPGLTGLWQVSGRNRLSYAHRVALDCMYVRNWSLFLDIAILIKTVPAILNFDQTA